MNIRFLMLAIGITCLLESYEGVTTRFLRTDERLITSLEAEMPLVFEAKEQTSVEFLQDFLKANSESLMQDVAKYGALLFRGFDVQSDHDFEHAILSIDGLHGISEALMSEFGRERVDGLKYVLHTNTVYKTGGTLYLGGFHSENYYTPDVPGFISFCCLKPSVLGGETGLVNMEKVYEHLDDDLKGKLENHAYFVEKWLVSDVAKRYNVSTERVEEVCRQFELPIVGEGENKLILMNKPSVFMHPLTQKKALQINFFSVPTLDRTLRKCFVEDYAGDSWFWHRFVWKLPASIFKTIENIFVFCAAFFHSPKELFQMTESKRKTNVALEKIDEKFATVNSCFSEADIAHVAQLMRNFYCSTLWQKGDILLVDNKKVAHAGMPGSGPRQIRALISNPLKMKYSHLEPGCFFCEERATETIGHYMAEGKTE
jgi:alpha-ketoglutarate-dependent taurine dioxygenase